MVATAKAAEVGRFRLGRQGTFLLKWTPRVGGGVKRRGVEGRSTGASNQVLLFAALIFNKIKPAP